MKIELAKPVTLSRYNAATKEEEAVTYDAIHPREEILVADLIAVGDVKSEAERTAKMLAHLSGVPIAVITKQPASWLVKADAQLGDVLAGNEGAPTTGATSESSSAN